jgi:hypothetical protein
MAGFEVITYGRFWVIAEDYAALQYLEGIESACLLTNNQAAFASSRMAWY